MGDLRLTPAGMTIFLLYIVISIKASKYDMRFRLVKNESYISLIFLSVSNMIRVIWEAEEINRLLCFTNFLVAFMVIMAVTIVITIFAVVTNAMGGGDVKYIFCSLLFLAPERDLRILILWFLVMFTLMFLYSMVIKYKKFKNREKGIPMVPFISIAGIIVIIISDFY